MKRVGIEDFRRWKREGQRFACLTAYDAPTARILWSASIPLILVGDSLGNVILGYRDTVPVTMEEMLHHTKAVRRGAPQGFVVADMPFLSFQVTVEEGVRNAGRFLKEGGADAVKIEGGAPRVELVCRLGEAGIPVLGHLGLTPQSATLLGGHRVQGADAEAAKRLLEDAEALDHAGVFGLVLECVPVEVSELITGRVSCPTIGIGAGDSCDAQILVTHDVLGYESPFHPRFVRRYADIEEVIGAAVKRFAADVENRDYPNRDELFHMSTEERERLRKALDGRAGEKG